MRQADGPSTGRQIGVGVALLVIDLMFVAWAVFAVGMEGWADSFESDGVPPGAPRVASQAAWLLGGSAVLTGRGLPGILQLVVLGFGAALVSAMGAG